jgi:hypothetical protein
MAKTVRTIIVLFLLTGNSGLIRAAATSVGLNTIPRKDSVPALPKLLYVVEGNQNYLIPYIERKLTNLRRPDTDSVLYGTVVNLNTLAATTGVEATVFDILRETYGSNFAIGRQGKSDKSQKTYSAFLLQFESILVIKDTTLQDLVELQFTLYSIIDRGSKLKYRNSSSVFVDPRSPHYQADVNRSLDQAFEKAGKQPKTNLVSNIHKVDSAFFLTPADTLVLQPIIEDESPEDDRIYFWTQDSTDKFKASIEPSKKNQVLTGLSQGTYHLYFKVSNGINYSLTDTVRLVVYTKPVLSVIRPNDKSFFRNFADRLVIQEYIFSNRQRDYFSDYVVTVDSASFKLPVPKLWVTVQDKKSNTYVKKSFDFKSGPKDTAKVSGKEIIDDIDTTESPLKPGGDSRYSISFVATNSSKESLVKTNELNVYQRWPISLLYDVMIFPVNAAGLYNSWINAGVGVDIRLNRWLSGIVIVGTDLAQASFKHFYTDLVANFGPYKHFEGGPALLINHDNGDQATGFKFSYTFYEGVHTQLKIGGSFYNQDHVNYYAIRLTGNILINH